MGPLLYLASVLLGNVIDCRGDGFLIMIKQLILPQCSEVKNATCFSRVTVQPPKPPPVILLPYTPGTWNDKYDMLRTHIPEYLKSSLHQHIQFLTGHFKVVSEGVMAINHQLAKYLIVALLESICSLFCPGDLRNHMSEFRCKISFLNQFTCTVPHSAENLLRQFIFSFFQHGCCHIPGNEIKWYCAGLLSKPSTLNEIITWG